MDPLGAPWIDGDTLEIIYSGVLQSLSVTVEAHAIALVASSVNDPMRAKTFIEKLVAFMPGETPVSVVIRVGRDAVPREGAHEQVET